MSNKGEGECRSEEDQLIRAKQHLSAIQERQEAFKKSCHQFIMSVESWGKRYQQHELIGKEDKIKNAIHQKQEALREYIQAIPPS